MYNLILLFFSHYVVSDSLGSMDCVLLGSSFHGISQARILEWGATPSPRDLLDPEIKPSSPALAGGLFATETTILWPLDVKS